MGPDLSLSIQVITVCSDRDDVSFLTFVFYPCMCVGLISWRDKHICSVLTIDCSGLEMNLNVYLIQCFTF